MNYDELFGGGDDFSAPVGVDLSNVNLDDFDLSGVGSGFSGDISNYGLTPDALQGLFDDPELMAEFANQYPDAAEIIQGISNTELEGYTKQAEQDTEAGGIMSPGAGGGLGTGVNTGTTYKKPSIPDKLKQAIARLTGLDENTVGELGKYGLLAGIAKMAYDDAQRAREEARGASGKAGTAVRAVRTPSGSTRYIKAASGGVMTLAGGGSVQPMYLGGVTDGMADKVPAHIDNKRPAALSDGEFVIPADVVSHLGNGNSNAGAKRLYEMMDSIREARTGNSKQGVQINPNKFLPG